MNQTVAKILSTVALETFEKLAFIFGVSTEENSSTACGESPVAVQVKFKGAPDGLLALRISAQSLPELTANMLGVDESRPISVEHQHDALREVVNVVCGRLLPLLGGKEAEFSIDQPEMLELGADGVGWPPADLVASVRLELEAGSCDLALAVKGPFAGAVAPRAVEATERGMQWNAL